LFLVFICIRNRKQQNIVGIHFEFSDDVLNPRVNAVDQDGRVLDVFEFVVQPDLEEVELLGVEQSDQRTFDQCLQCVVDCRDFAHVEFHCPVGHQFKLVVGRS